MSANPDLSIVILNYKMDGLVKNCLKSIFEHPTTKSLEVIVVDNNSQDQCEEIIQAKYPQVKFIQAGKNYGHAKGNNLGIDASTGRYVMILNPDIVFLDPIFDRLIDFLDREQKVGMTTVQLKNPDGSLQHGAWRFHKILTPLFQRSSFMQKTKIGQRAIKDFTIHDWSRENSRAVEWVQGSCLVVRRETIEKIGKLDERFFLYFTDVDWCRRCWDGGWKVYYYADISVIHYYNRQSAHKMGIKSLASKTTRIHIKDWFRYLSKYKGSPKPEIA